MFGVQSKDVAVFAFIFIAACAGETNPRSSVTSMPESAVGPAVQGATLVSIGPVDSGRRGIIDGLTSAGHAPPRGFVMPESSGHRVDVVFEYSKCSSPRHPQSISVKYSPDSLFIEIVTPRPAGFCTAEIGLTEVVLDLEQEAAGRQRMVRVLG